MPALGTALAVRARGLTVRYGDRLVRGGEACPADLEKLREAARAMVASTLERVRARPDAGEAELGLDEVCP